MQCKVVLLSISFFIFSANALAASDGVVSHESRGMAEISLTIPPSAKFMARDEKKNSLCVSVNGNEGAYRIETPRGTSLAAFDQATDPQPCFAELKQVSGTLVFQPE